MSARRWPIITLALIVVNVIVFLLTFSTIEEELNTPQTSEAQEHILILAATHPELKVPPDIQEMIETAKQRHPKLWERYANESVEVQDAWHARITVMQSSDGLQQEMDSLVKEYEEWKASRPETILGKYAFVPAKPTPMSYVTANFLHGGWLHLIFNMWFLWLAGFVLEDRWGRILYTIVYFLAGAAALQIHSWANPGSNIPALGASGAVAGLMGAFLVRFPFLKIKIALFYRLRPYTFDAQAIWLLPFWLLNEFMGTLWGSMSGIAHWAHIGGFVFGALAALLLRVSGLEHKADKAIEAKLDKDVLIADPAVAEAGDLMEQGNFDGAISLLNNYLATKPDSLDACSLLQQAHWRKSDLPAYNEATIKVCAMHLKAREPQLAWQDYQDFLNTGGTRMPAATWLELCRAAENIDLDRALSEYQKLTAAYPTEKQSLMAQIGAAKLCLKQNRAQEALTLYEAAKNSPIPHLDWEQTIEAGIRSAKAALAPQSAPPLGTRAQGRGA
jgi:membrane associated rhomboid family serine protease